MEVSSLQAWRCKACSSCSLADVTDSHSGLTVFKDLRWNPPAFVFSDYYCLKGASLSWVLCLTSTPIEKYALPPWALPSSALGLCRWSSLPPDRPSVLHPGRATFTLLWLLTCTLCVLFSHWPILRCHVPFVSVLSSACLLLFWERREARLCPAAGWSALCSVQCAVTDAWHVRASCLLSGQLNSLRSGLGCLSLLLTLFSRQLT